MDLIKLGNSRCNTCKRRLSSAYIRLVLDGLEGGPYKALHKVQLFGGVPLNLKNLKKFVIIVIENKEKIKK